MIHDDGHSRLPSDSQKKALNSAVGLARRGDFNEVSVARVRGSCAVQCFMQNADVSITLA